ncbi:NFYB/HAP3 family transcription factor subunit [Candidatus Bathyarchaeota archaeon]|jgi:histone H3/H4|nr:NFYB/HAP3 family transcription factor subunit [Candidatus Bathyarchaeota archaeon]MBS7627780.1 NFYB/HAP3 family transcription factor subunit [Candidatus Bathyarchaeota archaeon]
MQDAELQLAPMHRLLSKAGADRVSEGAAEELRRVLEEVAINLGREASILAGHAGRKTVRAEDIRLAAKRIIRE